MRIPGQVDVGVVGGLPLQLVQPFGAEDGAHDAMGLAPGEGARPPGAHHALVGEALAVVVHAQKRGASQGAGHERHRRARSGRAGRGLGCRPRLRLGGVGLFRSPASEPELGVCGEQAASPRAATAVAPMPMNERRESPAPLACFFVILSPPRSDGLVPFAGLRVRRLRRLRASCRCALQLRARAGRFQSSELGNSSRAGGGSREGSPHGNWGDSQSAWEDGRWAVGLAGSASAGPLAPQRRKGVHNRRVFREIARKPPVVHCARGRRRRAHRRKLFLCILLARGRTLQGADILSHLECPVFETED